MRVFVLAALAAVVLAGCASTKVVQRNGCWVRRTERMLGGVKEEIGPCMREQPKWVEDRLTRLVQECVAQADYRWQVAALDAWNKKQPLPPQEPQEKLLEACMSKGAAGMIAENEGLKSRLDEVTTDRDSLRLESEGAQAKLRTSEERLIGYLGEAAKKPAGTAVANASSTSDGKATNESGASLRSDAGSSAQPVGAPAPPNDPPVRPISAPRPIAPDPGSSSAAAAPVPAPGAPLPDRKARSTPAAPGVQPPSDATGPQPVTSAKRPSRGRRAAGATPATRAEPEPISCGRPADAPCTPGGAPSP
jgi:hypothetical protein